MKTSTTAQYDQSQQHEYPILKACVIRKWRLWLCDPRFK